MARAVVGTRSLRRGAVRAVVAIEARVAHASAGEIVAVAVRGAVSELGARGDGRRVDPDHHRPRHVAQLQAAIRPRVNGDVDGELAAHKRNELCNVQTVCVPRGPAVEGAGAGVGQARAVGAPELCVCGSRTRAVHAGDEYGLPPAVGAAVAEGVKGRDREAHRPANKVASAARRVHVAARRMARPEQLGVGRRQRPGQNAQGEVGQRPSAASEERGAHRVLSGAREHVEHGIVATPRVREPCDGAGLAGAARDHADVKTVSLAAAAATAQLAGGSVAKLVAGHEGEARLRAGHHLVRPHQPRDEGAGGAGGDVDTEGGALDVPPHARLVRPLHVHRVGPSDGGQVGADERAVAVVDHGGPHEASAVGAVEREREAVAARRARVAVHVTGGDGDKLEAAHSRVGGGEPGAVRRALEGRCGPGDDAERVGRSKELPTFGSDAACGGAGGSYRHARRHARRHLGKGANQVLARAWEHEVGSVSPRAAARRRPHDRGGGGESAIGLASDTNGEGRGLNRRVVGIVMGVASLDPQPHGASGPLHPRPVGRGGGGGGGGGVRTLAAATSGERAVEAAVGNGWAEDLGPAATEGAGTDGDGGGAPLNLQ